MLVCAGCSNNRGVHISKAIPAALIRQILPHSLNPLPQSRLSAPPTHYQALWASVKAALIQHDSLKAAHPAGVQKRRQFALAVCPASVFGARRLTCCSRHHRKVSRMRAWASISAPSCENLRRAGWYLPWHLLLGCKEPCKVWNAPDLLGFSCSGPVAPERPLVALPYQRGVNIGIPSSWLLA